MPRITDANGVPFLTDDGALVSIPHDHVYVHQGKMWYCEYSASVANAAAMLISITTGTKEMHIGMSAITGGAATVAFFEGPTISVQGTALTPVNLNRLNAVALTTGVAFKHTPTVTGDGTTLFSRLTPGGTNPALQIGNQARAGTEWILKKGTTYLMRITNSSGGNAILNPIFEFYEE